jgi:hypothetical protein
MGSMLKFDSDRRELVRERRQARMERKAQRREDRERTTTTTIPTAPATSTLSATQRAAEHQVRDEVDRIVEQALDHHDQRAGDGRCPHAGRSDHAGHPGTAAIATSSAGPSERSIAAHTGGGIAGRRRADRRRRRREPGAAAVASRP